jgi:hypothetical protein
MGRSDRLADMNEVYVHTKTTRKEQPAICLRHIEEKFGGLTVPKKGRARTQHGVPTNQLADMDGPNVRRRQPRPRYAGAEDKLIAETRQHMEEQFTILGDQIRALTTQFSNMGGHNGDGSGDFLRSAKCTDVSTMHKLMPINGETDSNSKFRNS